MDGDPVVCAEGDGQQGDRGEAEDGGEGERDGTTETHLDVKKRAPAPGH